MENEKWKMLPSTDWPPPPASWLSSLMGWIV